MTISFEHVLFFLLIFFILYHLIGSCSCGMRSRDGFSVGCQVPECDDALEKLDENCCKNNNCPEGYPINCDEPCKTHMQQILTSCSNTPAIKKNMCLSCGTPPDNCNDVSPSLRLVPDPSKGTVEQFFTRIKNAYNDPDSNGIFLSMIFNISMISTLENKIPGVYLDGSGSIVHNDHYKYLFPSICNFGFIWDIYWLENNLVSCLFPRDADTTPFDKCLMSQYNNLDTCILAHTSTNGKTPDRCSQGIRTYIKNFSKPGMKGMNPTNCNQNIKYIIDKDNPHKEEIENGKNCFTSIVDEIKSIQKWNYYNEAVFLKDIDEVGIEINEGIKKLTELSKPTPVALTYVYNDTSDCSTDVAYNKKQLKALKLNFTPDTLVIRIYYESPIFKPGILEFKNHTTLDQMPGYNDV